MYKIVVLISGNGSNLQAIIDAIKTQQIPTSISAVISNVPDSYGLSRANKENIPSHVVDHQGFQNRTAFENALTTTIDQYQPDLVVLAGFMRILTEDFVNHYLGHLINIHPSLLPKYPGLNTHKKALEAGDTEHGCTVHFVTPHLDAGPSIIQAKTPITSHMSLDTLIKKVQQLEHKIYPLAIQWLAEKRILLENQTVIFDKLPLPKTGYPFNEKTE